MYSFSFMNGNQLLKSMRYRVDNGIKWRRIMFFALDEFGDVCCWSLEELGLVEVDNCLTFSEFLKSYGFVELGFVFL